jgi:isopenicillin-N N-acyltransferase-like protein
MSIFSVPEIQCIGDPWSIGLAHGSGASERIKICLETYKNLFLEFDEGLSWEVARQRADRFVSVLESLVPELLTEIKGIAEGSKQDYLDIVVLNVRSEIALTQYMDGCTSLAQVDAATGTCFVAQNWDWVDEASKCLVLLDIQQPGCPRIKIMTEAGLVGKYGFNDAGLGLCMNALKSDHCHYQQLPVHIAVRKALECRSTDEALAMLKKRGVASAFAMVLGDRNGEIVSLECTPNGIAEIEPVDGRVWHTNHLFSTNLPPETSDYPAPDSFARLLRIQEISQTSPPSFENIRKMLSDGDGGSKAISRQGIPNARRMDRMKTLVTIIMNVSNQTAEISLGQPSIKSPIKKISCSSPHV